MGGADDSSCAGPISIGARAIGATRGRRRRRPGLPPCCFLGAAADRSKRFRRFLIGRGMSVVSRKWDVLAWLRQLDGSAIEDHLYQKAPDTAP